MYYVYVCLPISHSAQMNDRPRPSLLVLLGLPKFLRLLLVVHESRRDWQDDIKPATRGLGCSGLVWAFALRQM